MAVELGTYLEWDILWWAFKIEASPGQYGSVGWSTVPLLKGCGFDSPSGYIYKLWVWSSILNSWSRSIWFSVQACTGGNQWMFLSLPSSLSKSNEKKMSLGKDKKIEGISVFGKTGSEVRTVLDIGAHGYLISHRPKWWPSSRPTEGQNDLPPKSLPFWLCSQGKILGREK